MTGECENNGERDEVVADVKNTVTDVTSKITKNPLLTPT